MSTLKFNIESFYSCNEGTGKNNKNSLTLAAFRGFITADSTTHKISHTVYH